ncbi:MAG: NAD-dependent epimerase/dehydratase family protein [Pseudomonadota bacterium]
MPWLGLGLAEWTRPWWMVADTIDAYWLVLAMRQGIPSFLVLALGIALLIRATVVNRRRLTDPDARNMLRGWTMSLVALCLIGSTVHYWNVLQTYMFFLIGLGGVFADPFRQKVMAKRATIFGGSGFVGSYIARRLVAAGWNVRVAERNPRNDPDTTAVVANITDDRSVAAAVEGADAVVNCVGTFDKGGANSFEAIQHRGAERIAKLSSEAGVKRLVHISSIGADPKGASAYARSKGQGETAVLQHMPEAVILRPSVIFGPEDEFFNRFAAMTKMSPFLPLVGAGARFQPVYVDDVAEAAAKAVLGEAAPGIYELGGPDVASFEELMDQMMSTVGRRRTVLPIPLPIGNLMGWGFDILRGLSGGLIKGPITQDQARSLASDNIVSTGAKSFVDLGIEPTAIGDVIPSYLS